MVGALFAATATAAPLEARAAKATIYTTCKVPGTYALTFDDGPYQYTWDLATSLNKLGVSATFFINGNNWVNAATDSVVTSSGKKTYINVIKHLDEMGHQIASHTYSHRDLKGLSAAVVKKEMTDVEAIVKKAIGKKPTYMRPPSGVTDATSLQALGDLGYKVVLWDIDTNDWKTHSLTAEKAEFANVMGKETGTPKKGHISLMHDVHEQTVKELVPWAVPYIKSKKYKFVTVAECLGFSKASAYKA
ncbi:chitin deacetylase [Phycomyces blakesleeanus]|uniref:Chitin deacetylase n=2 Tax=Phycomyces blakesleeanus TaxID=4837 RepID=A0A167K5C5_PHYB8|nr:chitin deacetylase [Phycomyces blakesleeanus NRRL 1555(-)]OAD67316.1 chitin deacetylase [Phycomyces blakesleeanus NRRL 1555(-)]|eukprot:XP_018285356.1 chitin deacetylase [Phycomyces blakesleeanus NRRL 1555(-)]